MLRREFNSYWKLILATPFIHPVKDEIESETLANKVAVIFTDMFIRKIHHYTEKEGVRNIYSNSFSIFNDPLVHRNRRYGWYAWVETDHPRYSYIGLSTDVLMSVFNYDDTVEARILDLINNHMQDYFVHGIVPAGAAQFTEELNGIES